MCTEETNKKKKKTTKTPQVRDGFTHKERDSLWLRSGTFRLDDKM